MAFEQWDVEINDFGRAILTLDTQGRTFRVGEWERFQFPDKTVRLGRFLGLSSRMGGARSLVGELHYDGIRIIAGEGL